MRAFHYFAALSILLCLTEARAASRLSGLAKYEIVEEGASVAITVPLIENLSREDATGRLQLQLWATEKRYEGGPLNGYQLASCKLEGLDRGQSYKDRREVVPYLPPKFGTYAVCLLLLEFKNGIYTPVNHVNVLGTAKLGTLREITMEGPFRWETSYEGGTMNIGLGKITHRRKGTTGSLKIAVWASEEPYNGRELQGHELGSVMKGGLKPGSEYNGLKNVAKFTPPPGGTYHIVFALSEFGATREYTIVDYYNQPDTVTFPALKE